MTMYLVETASGNRYWINGDTNVWVLEVTATQEETRGATKGFLIGPRPPRVGDSLLLQWPTLPGKLQLARTAPVTVVDVINDSEEEVLG